MDDILVWGATEDEHDRNLRNVLQRLPEVNRELKLKKCQFGKELVKCLGHVLTADGVNMYPEGTKAIGNHERARKYQVRVCRNGVLFQAW